MFSIKDRVTAVVIDGITSSWEEISEFGLFCACVQGCTCGVFYCV